MRNEKNICQYCTSQCAIITLSLNACLNQINQELSNLLTLPGYISSHLTALYIRILI